MNFSSYLINNPIFLLLFGGGGILVVLIPLIALIKKRKKSDRNDGNINIDINLPNPPAIKDPSPQYINIPLSQNQPQYIASPSQGQPQPNNVSPIQNQPQPYNNAPPAQNESQSYNISFKNQKEKTFKFSQDEYYINFLKTLEEKKKGSDKIDYE